MANPIVANCNLKLNRQQVNRERLLACIHQAKSLIRISIDVNWHNLARSVVVDCCCVIDDLLEEALAPGERLA